MRRRFGRPHKLVNARCERGDGVLQLFARLAAGALIGDIIGGRAYGLILLKQRRQVGQRRRRIADRVAVGKLGGVPSRRARAQKRQLVGVGGNRLFHIVIDGCGILALNVFLAHQRGQPLRETRDFPIPMRRLRGQVVQVVEYHGQRAGRARGGVGCVLSGAVGGAARGVAYLHH